MYEVAVYGESQQTHKGLSLVAYHVHKTDFAVRETIQPEKQETYYLPRLFTIPVKNKQH